MAAILPLGVIEAGPQQPPAIPTPSAPASPAPVPTTPTAPVIPTGPRNALAVVVLDAAHGGVDTGARGSTGIVESEVAMSYARLMRAALEGAGLRVILTRPSNQAVGWDERSKTANAQRGAVFVSIHVASTGAAGTVRVYSLPQVSSRVAAAASSAAATGPARLIPWDRAQQSYLPLSRKLAELVQAQMNQRFRGSPVMPSAAAVRQLRTVAAPAIAIEVSSVSVPERATLDKMGPTLAEGLARAMVEFGAVYNQGAR